MKKLIGIFTVLLVFCASSAFVAAAFVAQTPAYYNGTLPYVLKSDNNGTQLFMTGFGVANGTSTHPTGASTKTWGELNVFRSEIASSNLHDLFIVNASNSLDRANDGGPAFNGTVYYVNGTGTAVGAEEIVIGHFGNNSKAVGSGAGSYLKFGQTFNNITGLTTLAMGNNTLNATTYFVPAGGHQLMVGIANATSNLSGSKVLGHMKNNSPAGNGISMAMVYQNGTFKNIADGAVWDYYAYGQKRQQPVVVFGQVKINGAYDATSTTGNAQARYYVLNGTGGIASDGASGNAAWVYYNATNLTKGTAGGSLKLTRDDAGYQTLFENATINKDENMVTGYVVTGGQKLFAVMIKNGQNLSDSYFTNKGFNTVYAGSGRANHELGNSTAGIMQFGVDQNMELSGSMQTWLRTTRKAALAAGHQYPVGMPLVSVVSAANNMDGGTVGVTSTSQFKIAQTNATFKDNNENVIGYFYGKRSSDDLFAVGIYEVVSSGDVLYRTLAFIMPTAAYTSATSSAADVWQSNASMIDPAKTNCQVRGNSTMFTSKELRTTWTNLPSDFTPLTELKGYNLTTEGVMGSGKAFYYTSKFLMGGLSGKIADLQLYKLMVNGNSAAKLPYASAPAYTTDGAWWISDTDGNGYRGPNSVLESGTTYYVNWVVRDNGSYDTNNTKNGQIVDPVVLGIGGSSSSSSGCVFNPAAGFGLEWLLLMLAPMVAIVRSRFK